MTTQALTPRILTLEINKSNKVGTLKKRILSLFDLVIIFVISNWIVKENIYCTTFSEQYLK